MKLKALVAGMALVALTQGAMAAEPTRGFLLEKGVTSAMGSASLDAAVANYTDIAARLGLGNAELLLSRQNVGTNNSTGAVLKIAIKEVEGLAVYGGLAQYDGENDWGSDTKYLNLKGGAAFSVTVDQIELNANAELVIDDSLDETYMNIGAGAFLKLAKTAYGTFKPGFEVIASTLDGSDTHLVAGVRWEYNNRLIIDVLPLDFGGIDTIAVPGQVTVNFSF